MTNGNRNTTPNLIQVLESVIDGKLCELHTAMPAEIVSYDYDRNLAVVRPTLKRKYKNQDESIDLPNISNVPVSFQRMGPAHLRLPIKTGQTGQLIINERSIDAWLVNGGQIDPIDPRKHSLSDAVFYPGLNPIGNKIESLSSQDSIELKLNGSYIEILDSGKFKISNGTEEVLDLMVQMLGEMVTEMTEQGENDFTNTVFGPQQPTNFAQYTALKGKYETLKTKMESLKG